MITKRRSVGLALGERGIVAAEVTGARGRREVVRVAELAFPEGLSWDDPQAVGAHLGQFLRERHVRGRVVVGLPARWLVTAAHEVPPVGGASLAGMLRLAAEREFSLGSDEMACDYASAPPEGEAGTALLVGTTREQLGAVEAAARGAGLKLRAVTSTGAALALAGSAPADLTAAAAPDGVEVVRVGRGGVTAIRYVPLPGRDGAPGAVAGALRLAVGSVPAGPEGRSDRIALWGGAGAAGASLRGVCGELGLELDAEPGLALAGLAEASAEAGVPVGRAAPAAALAAAGLDGDLLPFDLVHSRLAARHALRLGRPVTWAAALLVTFLIAGWAVVSDRIARKEEIAELQSRLTEMAPSIEAAESVVESVRQARGWHDRRPAFLDSLVGVTLAFPENGSIWATSLAVREDTSDPDRPPAARSLLGALSGKATDERSVLAVLDALTAAGEFVNVNLLYVQETRGAGGDSAFAISFAYVGTD